MIKLFYAPASPYSAKVLIAARAAGVPVERVKVDTAAQPAELLAVNPLGRIPVLLAEDGLAIHDSRSITHYLDRLSGRRLFPRQAEKRTRAEVLELMADGICDSLLDHVYERRFRPQEKVHAPWLDRLWAKAVRALDLLEEAPPRLAGRLDAGQIALRCCLGYMDLRFDGVWRQGRPQLQRWAKAFDRRHPDLVPLLPH